MNNFEYKENNKQFFVSVGLQGANSIHELNKNYEPRYKDEVLVVKTIMLSDKDFEQFINHLLDDYNFIRDNGNHLSFEEVDPDFARLDKVMLITSQGVDFGIIVDTQGYDYAKYTAYYKKIKTPHQKLLDLGFKHTEYTNYNTYKNGYITIDINTLRKGYNVHSAKHNMNYIIGDRNKKNYVDLELAEILADYLKELQYE